MFRQVLAAGAAVVVWSSTAPMVVAAEDEEEARGGRGVIEEIVVTSRRRNESQQDVPLSVTAFGPAEIEQLKPSTLRDFDGLAPNVYVGMNTAGPSASAIYIRGVGYADIEKTQSPQVGVIVDGVQIGSSTGQLIDVFDVESIEINRGPQGVLFGKNTIGGNIVVNRTRPQFNELTAKAAIEYGNYQSEIYKVRVNIPVFEDKVALKIGAIERQREGFYDNNTIGGSAGDVDFHSQTAAVRAAIGERVDAIFTYDRIRDNSQIPPQDPRFDGDNPFINLADKREPTDYDVDQMSLRVNWDYNDILDISSITAWHDSKDQVNQDFDGGSINGTAVPFAQLHTLRDQDYRVFTQEIRLHGTILQDRVDFMAGWYYFDSTLDFRQDTNNVLQLPGFALGLPAGLPCAAAGLRANGTVGDAICQVPNSRSTQLASEDVESMAWFGSVTVRPTDTVELSVGARWIDERKQATNAYFDFSDGTFDAPGAPEHDFSAFARTVGTAYSVSDSWDDFIVTASGSWQFRENSRAYVSYAEGFRSGGFSIRSARTPGEAGFDPEEAFQLEVGVKNEFFERRLQVNLAYFYLERDDAQFSSIIPLPPGAIPGTTTLINNGGTSELQGFEFESTAILPYNLTLTANFGILDVENSQFNIACELLDGCVTATPGILDPQGTPRTLGGNSDSRQPEWNYNVSMGYDRQWGPGTFSANVGYKKVGDFLLVNTGGGADQRLTEGGYGQLDARVAYEWVLDSGGILNVSVFGKNLTDEEFKEQALFLGGPQTGFQGWGAPQTYAIELVYSHDFGE